MDEDEPRDEATRRNSEMIHDHFPGDDAKDEIGIILDSIRRRPCFPGKRRMRLRNVIRSVDTEHVRQMKHDIRQAEIIAVDR